RNFQPRLASQSALHGETRQCPQRFGAMVEPVEGVMRAALEIARELPRFVQADNAGISVLAVRDVLARPLAHLLGRGLDVEDVVDHLEGESERARVSLQRLELRLSGAA